MKKLLLSATMLALAPSLAAQEYTWNDLKQHEKITLSREINKQLAMYSNIQTDEISTIANMIMMPDGNLNINYDINLDYYGNTIDQIRSFVLSHEYVNTNTAYLCTHPEIRMFMDMDITFVTNHRSTNGHFISRTKTTSADCKTAGL